MNLRGKTVRFREAFNPSTPEYPDLQYDDRESELRLTRDLTMAREVQQQLLHREIRDGPGIDLATACVPVREPGGDFYDLLPYGSGRLALALGDVSARAAQPRF